MSEQSGPREERTGPGDRTCEHGRVVYTASPQVVIDSERGYIARRRQAAQDERPGEDLWGICFSGGGVRSATTCLGIVQSLTRAGVMKSFDYLSTVSGGGYLGSAMTSLLTGRRPGVELGLDAHNSPFVGLDEETEDKTSEETVLSPGHQLRHLRKYGEYLAPRRSGLLSRDIERAIGTIVPGVIHHLLLFLLLLGIVGSGLQFGLTFIDKDLTLLHGVNEGTSNAACNELFGYVDEREEADPAVAPLGSPEFETDLVPGSNVVRQWVRAELAPIVCEFLGGEWHPTKGLFEQRGDLLAAGLIGGGWYLLWIAWFSWGPSSASRPSASDATVAAGLNVRDSIEIAWIQRLNKASFVATTAVVLGFAFFEDWHYSTGLFLPFAFALGGLLIASPVILVIESRSPSRKSRRSLLAATQGATVTAVLLWGLFPVVLVLVFTLTKIPANNFLMTLGALSFAYFLTLEPDPRSRPSAIRRLLISWREPLLSASVIFAVALGLSWMLRDVLATGTYPVLHTALGQIPDGVRKSIQLDDGHGFQVRIEALVTLLASVSVFVVLGFAFNSNRVSPHYFYRDRLTEAFLTTEARVKRRPTEDRQGRPTVVLRDDEDLRLEEMGDENHRGPYHLIVASLNLSGTQELDRKTMLSDHFIFAKNYVGARQTGYVCTSCYRKGETKLARAMAISGAAASGAAGQHTSFLWSFAMTLFNVRLGYWMENPWNYRFADRKPIAADGWIFWPKYLARELTGAVDASDPLVNLSDGGHTGDNLGLVPLLARRCRLIVVCDCEQDEKFEFGSFNNAVRMALIEQGVVISIDLHGVVPENVEGGVPRPGESCVAVGKILYPATSSRPKEEGVLVYIKAELMRGSPAHVWNYAVGNPAFPHQTTGDQFFDDAQFEAYRALGETLGVDGASAVKEASRA